MTDGRLLAETGVTEVARRTGARTAFFHDGDTASCAPTWPPRPTPWRISEYLYEADVVISVPSQDALQHLVTMALKNLKGCLRP